MTPGSFDDPLTVDEILGALAFLTALHHDDDDAIRLLTDDKDQLIRGLCGVFLDLAGTVAEINGESVCMLLRRCQTAAVAEMFDST